MGKEKPMKALCLFSGIGGFSRGITEAKLNHKFQVEQFVEIDPFCQRILRKHYPNTPIHADIREYTGRNSQFDVVVGGSPCQDISQANPNASGFEGSKSSLFWEMARIVTEVRPKYVIWENVAAATRPVKGQTTSPLGDVLWFFSQIGYDAEWEVCSASSLGAPHKRERIFVIAYPHGTFQGKGIEPTSWGRQIGEEIEAITNAASEGRQEWQARVQGQSPSQEHRIDIRSRCSDGYSLTSRIERVDDVVPPWLDGIAYSGWWNNNPPPHSISAPRRSVKDRGKRIAALGNAVTPQQAALCWKRIDYLDSLLKDN